MSESVDQEAVHSLLCGASRTEEEDPAIPFSSLTTLCHPILKHRFTLLFPKTSDLYALLDVVKVCVCWPTPTFCAPVLFTSICPKGKAYCTIHSFLEVYPGLM